MDLCLCDTHDKEKYALGQSNIQIYDDQTGKNQCEQNVLGFVTRRCAVLLRRFAHLPDCLFVCFSIGSKGKRQGAFTPQNGLPFCHIAGLLRSTL